MSSEFQSADYLDLAFKAINLASQNIQKCIASNDCFKIEDDRLKDLKLALDSETETILYKVLSEESGIPFLGEEAGQRGKLGDGPYWVVDPIDGTFNLFRGIPFYASTVSLWVGSEPVLGVTKNIVSGDIYHAILNGGAFLNRKKITVSKTTLVNQSVIATGFPINYDFKNLREDLEFYQNFKKVRMLGSAALSLCLLAEGSIDCYMEKNIKIWDVGAGLLIVKEAGGEVSTKTTIDEKTLDVKCTNGKIKF